ncbi:MAG: Haloalkane dehalogenase [Gemmatimonadaceae bacterium]|nr:Haloalkane dehalogenase [Gemmatimonadaceae bacterium]
MRGEFVDVGGARLYYYAAGSRGSGEPILLIHGFPTSSHLWHDLVPLLPSGHRVVVVDLLGYGRSDVPGDRDLSLRGHASRVIALLDVLGIGAATVVGHDVGGGVAQAMAIGWPARVTRLCLCNSVGFDQWPGRETRLARAAAPLTRHVPSDWIIPLVRRDLLRGYVVPSRGARSVEHYLRPFLAPEGREVLLRHLRALDARETAGFEHRLGDVVVPTSVVWGAEDPFLPGTIAQRLARSIPCATLDYIPDVSHFVPEEAPERLAQAIAGLVRQ